MMKRHSFKKMVIVFALFIPGISAAFFCPTNFSQIDFGMSLDNVIQLCGPPDVDKKYPRSDENTPQEWTYFIPQSVAMSTFEDNTGQGTLKTTVTFNEQNKAINISVNGLGVGASQICGSKSIQLGSSKEVVKAACGEPVAVNKLTNSNILKKEDIIINEFHYNKTNPNAVLIFENGVLTSRK